MKPQEITTDVLIEKYAKGTETCAEDIFKRVSKGIASAEKTEELRTHWEKRFFENMMNGAIGAGRIMSAAGSVNGAATLINCFAQPVGDSIRGFDEDGIPGIYEALSEAAETMRRGGGVGYNFSLIRPKGASVGSIGSLASGPCSYMDVFDSSCKTVESAGARRGAQMGILNINHPDIEEFIIAKRTEGRWNNFNVSVFVTDEFMRAKDADEEIHLVHKAKPSEVIIEAGAYQLESGLWSYRRVMAKDLWSKIMKSNYDFAEPGILFENKINDDNNLRYCEYIIATNPCAEQPLPSYGCCDLGPIILTKFVRNPFTAEAYFDMSAFTDAVITQVRFLDNVLDVTVWPLTQQKIEADNKRRIGVGFTGLGNALAMLQIKYNSDEGIEQAKYIAETMRNAAYVASIDLAKEKGSFPLLNVDKYLEEGTFASRLPEAIKEEIRTHGIRNSHLLSIAPTGTVSLAFADNASNGIEPPFSLAYTRKKRTSDGSTVNYTVLDHAFRVYLNTLNEELAYGILEAIKSGKNIFTSNGKEIHVNEVLAPSLITAMDMTPEEHGAMVKAVQPYIDTSISKTVNVPADCPYEDFIKLYDQAYAAGLKGISTYRPNSIIGSVLSVIAKEEPKIKDGKQMECEISNDLFNDFIASRPVGKLPSITTKVEYLSSSYVEDSFYVGVSFLKEIKRPIEVFFTVCPNGVPQEWLDAYAINLSFLARGGLDVFCKALRTLRKVKSDKGQVRYGWHTKADGNKVPKYHNSEVACMAFAIQELLMGEGVIDELGYPVKQDVVNVGLIHTDKVTVGVEETSTIIPGKQCTECGAYAVIRKDGCSFCTNCSVTGSCG